jgi:hypothetical protein
MGSLLPAGVSLRQRRKIQPFRVGARVTINDAVICCQPRKGRAECVRWDELVSCYAISTLSEHLHEDVFFIFADRKGKECLVPQYAAPEDLLQRMGRLPGFDARQLLEAMVSTSSARFVLWRAEE